MSAVDFAQFVERLADAASAAILPFFRSAIHAHDKSHGGAFDPVTEADRGAEVAMRGMIRDHFPAHGVVGEEFGTTNPEAEYVWVLDPIDGTKSFISGFPTWGVLIGLQHRGRPVYGMMRQPFTRESFVGDGAAAHWRGLDPSGAPVARPLHSRACADLGQATLMTTSPLLIPEAKRDAYARVERAVRLPRFGGDCYAYAALAGGFVDVVVEAGLKPYDIVALIPVIEGAGGIVTTWDGGDAAGGGDVLASGDPRTHEQAMALLARG
ncbi:MAG: histidinol-phosphatase [Hyphomicrobiales bacterium]|nr:histidinol-phosphatase [Hyphomicrobiales bacterium]MDE2016165.1 histidinol-phosphatase [Hyphomicrobiales bacterium]